MPIFKVTCESEDFEIEAENPTKCWIEIIWWISKNDAHNQREEMTVSGPEWFGLTNERVLDELKKQPEAKKCAKFRN